MDLGLKDKVAMVAGASRGLGYAVAEALAREGALVSIASRDEQAISAAAKKIGGDTLAVPVDVKSAEAIAQWTSATKARFGGVDLLFTNSGGPPAGARHFLRRPRLAGRSRPAAVQHDPDDPRRRASSSGARRRRDSRLHLVVGQRADCQSRAVDGVAGVGVGARQDARARARSVEDSGQSDHSRPHRHRSCAPARPDRRYQAEHLP